MNLRLVAALGLLWLIFASCGFGRQATGVVVWAPDGSAVHNGEIVWIWEQSRIRHSFKIQPVDGSTAFETDQWRVRSFAGEGEAKAFQAAFLPFKDTWAVAGKQGLPVRDKADANADRVYKLGDTEEVKVLSQNATKVKQGNLEGTWVQVLTRDGYSGWVFDYYLTLVDKSKGGALAVKTAGPGDENVQLILDNTWYPEEMRLMVEQDRLVPERFRAELGLRPVSGSGSKPTPSFLLTLPAEGGPDQSFELPYDTPQKVSPLSYLFGGPEKLAIDFNNADLDKITVRFTAGGQAQSFRLATLPDTVGTLLSRELASRQQKWAELKNRGSVLVSPTYGTITLGADGAFTWDGYETLQPPSADIFPAALPGHGKIVYDWFKDRKLLGEFNVVRFAFGDTPEAYSQLFLYRFLKDGFQLLPVAARDTDPAKQTVLRESRTGLSLFFTFAP